VLHVHSCLPVYLWALTQKRCAHDIPTLPLASTSVDSKLCPVMSVDVRGQIKRSPSSTKYPDIVIPEAWELIFEHRIWMARLLLIRLILSLHTRRGYLGLPSSGREWPAIENDAVITEYKAQSHHDQASILPTG
jgi:hypothetical protein